MPVAALPGEVEFAEVGDQRVAVVVDWLDIGVRCVPVAGQTEVGVQRLKNRVLLIGRDHHRRRLVA